MVQIWGWSRAEAARASRSKRSKSLAVLGKTFGQELQGDEAAELGVLGLINHTHPAATQPLEDAVMRNGSP